MQKDTYAKAITFLAVVTFTFMIGGAFGILNSTLLYNAGLSSFAYLLVLSGLISDKKTVSNYIYITIGSMIILLISCIYLSMFVQILNTI